MEDLVVFNDVVKIYNGLIKALDKASFRIPRGVIAGLLGPNGSGKTTSFKLILGLLKPNEGSIKVFGMDPWVNEVEVRSRIGYLPEKPVYPDARVYEYLRFVRRVRGARVEDVIRLAKMFDIYKYLYTRINGLSRGYLQRLGLTQALIGDPELLLLDEPTANLDPSSRREILGLIKDLAKELDITIIVATHILPEMKEIANYIIFINKGRIVEHGPIDELTKRYRVEAYYLVYTDSPRRIASEVIVEEYVKGVEIIDHGLIVRIDSTYSDLFEELLNTRYSTLINGYKLVTGELGELYEKLAKII